MTRAHKAWSKRVRSMQHSIAGHALVQDIWQVQDLLSMVTKTSPEARLARAPTR